jgi:endonuclease/exonuclease/phosphatase family metal-dependent hydrolase
MITGQYPWPMHPADNPLANHLANPIITISSINLATSQRDEIESPLYLRLPILSRVIGKVPWFDILVVQELRASGPLSVNDVLRTIREILGDQWDFYNEPVNPSNPRSAHRTIFWNTMKVIHDHSELLVSTTKTLISRQPILPRPTMLCPSQIVHQNTFVSPNPTFFPFLPPSKSLPELYFPYPIKCLPTLHPIQTKLHPFPEKSNLHDHPSLIVKSYFYRVGTSSQIPQFDVMNVHAPLKKTERCQYWIDIRRAINPTSIVIGDMNKFNTEREFYDEMFCRQDAIDLIPPDAETFVSFDGDRQPSVKSDVPGELWRSALDAVIINPTYLQGEVHILSTEEPPRLSDHFFITATIYWAS